MDKRDTHSSAKILTGIAGIFVTLIVATGIVVALRAPHPFDISLTRPGTHVTPTAYIRYTGQDGKNALELLKAHVRVSTQQTSYGEYVDTIDGVQSGKNGKYWALYVNGKQVPIAANNLITHNGDQLEWRYQQ